MAKQKHLLADAHADRFMTGYGISMFVPELTHESSAYLSLADNQHGIYIQLDSRFGNIAGVLNFAGQVLKTSPSDAALGHELQNLAARVLQERPLPSKPVSAALLSDIQSFLVKNKIAHRYRELIANLPHPK